MFGCKTREWKETDPFEQSDKRKTVTRMKRKHKKGRKCLQKESPSRKGTIGGKIRRRKGKEK